MTAANTNRRRRTVTGRRAPTGLLRSPAFGRRLFGAMLSLGVLYLAAGLYRVERDTRVLGLAYVGMTQAEARYVYGPPTRGRDGDMVWEYRDAGALNALRFDAGNSLRRAGCAAVDPSAGASCPAILGIGLGTGEGEIWNRLGIAPVQLFRGQDKIVAYPELGIRFLLRRLQVVAIEHRAKTGGADRLWRGLRLLAP